MKPYPSHRDKDYSRTGLWWKISIFGVFVRHVITRKVCSEWIHTWRQNFVGNYGFVMCRLMMSTLETLSFKRSNIVPQHFGEKHWFDMDSSMIHQSGKVSLELNNIRKLKFSEICLFIICCSSLWSFSSFFSTNQYTRVQHWSELFIFHVMFHRVIHFIFSSELSNILKENFAGN